MILKTRVAPDMLELLVAASRISKATLCIGWVYMLFAALALLASQMPRYGGPAASHLQFIQEEHGATLLLALCTLTALHLVLICIIGAQKRMTEDSNC